MRRLLVTGAAVLVAALGHLVPTGSSAQASPGTPGEPRSGVPLFEEGFQNASATAVGIDAYVGADGMRYTADAIWTPAGQSCNGWVMKAGSPRPADTGCTENIWNRTQALATALGRAQGMADPTTNQALTGYTNRASGNDGYQGTMLKTRSGIPATGGHYYAVSAYVGEASCELQPDGNADLTFHLIKNGTEVELQSGLKPCVVGTVDRGPDTRHATPPATPSAAQRIAMQDDVWIAHLVSDALQLGTVPTGGPQTGLGFRLSNATDTGTGNDVVFDLPQIVDVTPQLDKSFSPTTIAKGETATLTYTITNTDELAAKDGWNFTDVLPTGLTAVGPPTTGSTGPTCAGFTGSADDGRVVVTGSLADGQAWCTVTLGVTAATGGYYTNGADNFPASTAGPDCAGGPGVGLCGLNAPDDATLTVTPILVDDAATTPYLTEVTVRVLDNDVDLPDGSTVTALQPDDPSQGTWTLNLDGTVRFSPAAGFDSVATATYTVTYPDSTTSTARVTVTVLVPPPPITSASASTGIAGTGQPGDDVTVTLPDGSIVTTPVGADGTWSVPASRLTPAQRVSLTPNSSVAAVQTDPSTSHGSTPTSMPLPPSVVTDGTSASGRGIPGAVVTVTGDGATQCTATVAADETWSCTFTTPLDPATSVSARQTHDGRTTPESLVSTTTVGSVDPPGAGPQSGPTGVGPGPVSLDSSATLVTRPAATSSDALASTGADLGVPAAVGVVAIAAGIGLVVAAQTRSRRTGSRRRT